MALYEYSCPVCGHKEDVNKPMSKRNEEVVCYVCNGTMIRLVSSVAFHLKGTGWYSTDYKNKSSKSKSSKDKEDV